MTETVYSIAKKMTYSLKEHRNAVWNIFHGKYHFKNVHIIIYSYTIKIY